ncbi:peroxiredoxin-like 2C isoform X2 [Bombina bombina]|uniref:peroxiredoxin-like 2C isoform X2 n=1 Tax=Bombina bombina TaxID=8345 RepID=UPI00235B1E1A|nr:peroxiredoxin-like 2C isoform X2 [Bombina bombina]
MDTLGAPVTIQIGRNLTDLPGCPLYHPDLEQAADCLVWDKHGKSLEFKELYRNKKAIVVFVRNFLCYTCKEYVEDLAKIPKSFLEKADARLIVIGQSSYLHIQAFCSLTGYPHEIYVDPDRAIYSKLGLKKGENSTSSAGNPHVKSNLITGSIKSMWRAMMSPAFDFQGDPAQQGNKVHFLHRDMNRLDQASITSLLQHAGVQPVHFGSKPKILEV